MNAPRFDLRSAATWAVIQRLSDRPDIEGFQFEKPKVPNEPVAVGVKRAGHWHWFYGASLYLALRQALAGTTPRKAIDG